MLKQQIPLRYGMTTKKQPAHSIQTTLLDSVLLLRSFNFCEQIRMALQNFEELQQSQRWFCFSVLVT